MINGIKLAVNRPIETDLIISLYRNCGLPRPVNDQDRIAKMFANSNLVISAWFGDDLVGVARSITDFAWCCYLADLAVREDFQKAGVGRALIELTKETVGEGSMVLLLSVRHALEYYPKIKMERVENGFIFNRKF